MHQIIKRAFTLIELLVVIAIIGILSGLIIVTMNGVTAKANIAKSQIFSNSLRNALMLNLVSEWKLDNASGATATDSWSGGNNLSLVNFPSTAAGYGDANSDGWLSSANCVFGTCIEFNGANSDYLYVPGSDAVTSNLAITGAITLSVWVKFNGNGTSGGIIGRGLDTSDHGNYGYYIRRYGYDNKIYFYTHSSTVGEELPSNTPIVDTNWHFIVASWDGTTGSSGKKIYLDGAINGQGGSSLTAIGKPTSLFRIGMGGSGNQFTGSIDDIRVYNAAIPASQIKEQYYSGLNKLLANGAITNSEYLERIGEVGYSK